MKHGEQQNTRIETQLTSSVSAITQTVSERWCEHCQEWITCEGIIGHLFCHKCNATW